MNQSENKKSEQAEETKETSSSKGFFYYFDISYRVAKALVIILAVTLLVGGSLGAGAAVGYFASLVHSSEIPEYEEMEAQIDDYTLKSSIYYGSGELVSDVRSDLVRTPVNLEQVSPYVVNAIIATEDEYFFKHNGIVPKAVARALVQDLTNSASSSGGSTLTQQLIKQQLVGNEVTHERKANEILLAMRLENFMSKEDILQSYLNISPFGRNNKGENIAGVQEAAQGIFGVAAADLTLPQASFIAGLPQSPIVYSPYTQTGEFKDSFDYGLQRQKEVLFRMYREGYITEAEYQEAVEYDITQDFINQESIEEEDQSYVYDLAFQEASKILKNHLIQQDGLTAEEVADDEELNNQYLEETDAAMRNGGYKIYTTIDKAAHNAVEQVVAEQIDTLGRTREYTWTDVNGETHTQTYPMLVSGSLIDNATGKVLAFIGGRDYEEDNYNIAFEPGRSPGSIIKPLATYGPALDVGMITPATLIPDTEVSFPQVGQDPYEPTNAGPITNRWMTAREALTISQNIPTIKIFNELNDQVNPGIYMERMGIGNDRIPLDVYESQLATAIGGVSTGPSAVELVSAFSSIANNGVHADPYVIERIEDQSGEAIYQHEQVETRVWNPQANYLLLDILRDVHTEGTARNTINQLNFNSDFISKTGTAGRSDLVTDIWYVASTPKISLGTWIGYDNINVGIEDEFGLSASRRNRNFWAKVMNKIYEANPELVGAGETYQQPDNIEQRSVLEKTGMLPGTIELPNGDTREVSGETFTEIFSTNNLPETSKYDFAIGATDEELAEYWSTTLSKNDQTEEEPNQVEVSTASANTETKPDTVKPEETEEEQPQEEEKQEQKPEKKPESNSPSDEEKPVEEPTDENQTDEKPESKPEKKEEETSEDPPDTSPDEPTDPSKPDPEEDSSEEGTPDESGNSSPDNE